MDNYTDTIMLTEAASADEAPPLTAMMTNTAYNVDNFETLADDLQWYIESDWAAGAQRTDAPALVPVLLRAVLARLPRSGCARCCWSPTSPACAWCSIWC